MSDLLFLRVEPKAFFEDELDSTRVAFKSAASRMQLAHASSERQLALVKCSGCEGTEHAYVRPFIVYAQAELIAKEALATGERNFGSPAAASQPAASVSSSEWDPSHLEAILASCSKINIPVAPCKKDAKIEDAESYNYKIYDGFVRYHACKEKASGFAAAVPVKEENSELQSAGRVKSERKCKAKSESKKRQRVEPAETDSDEGGSDSNTAKKSCDANRLPKVPPAHWIWEGIDEATMAAAVATCKRALRCYGGLAGDHPMDEVLAARKLATLIIEMQERESKGK